MPLLGTSPGRFVPEPIGPPAVDVAVGFEVPGKLKDGVIEGPTPDLLDVLKRLVVEVTSPTREQKSS